MTVLVTGGSGFLGAAIVRHMVTAQGVDNVVVFDRYPRPEVFADIADAVTVVHGDVLQLSELVAAAERYDVDAIAHMSSLLGLPEPARIAAYQQFQLTGTMNVYETARALGIKRVVNASSSGVYSDFRPEPVDEDVVPRPRHLYGAHKVWSEYLAEYYNATFDMEILTLRPCGTYGYGRLDRNARLAHVGLTFERGGRPHFMANIEYAAMGIPVVMPPDDEISDFIYSDDVGYAWYLALTKPKPEHAVFNLRAHQRPVGEFTAHLRKLLPDADITVQTERNNLSQLMDNTRIVTELGFTPRFSLEAGLDDFLANFERDRAASTARL